MGIADQATALSAIETLARRIVEAARLAVAAHVADAGPATTDQLGRQTMIGGAGPVAPATADRVHARRPFDLDRGAAEGAD